MCRAGGMAVPKVGDYFSIEVIGQPLIVVRDDGNQGPVQSALCYRHRGAISTEKAGHCRAFVCPYHSWTYNLSPGKLSVHPGNPPPMAGVEGFRKEDHTLNQVRSELWGGFIFITNQRPGAAPAPVAGRSAGLPPGLRPGKHGVDQQGRLRGGLQLEGVAGKRLRELPRADHPPRPLRPGESRRTGSSSVPMALGGHVQQAQHRCLFRAAAGAGPGRDKASALYCIWIQPQPADHPARRLRI